MRSTDYLPSLNELRRLAADDSRALAIKGAARSMAIVQIDGLPYIDVGWLALRIYRDEARAKRWRQEARRVAHRKDLDGISLHGSYLWQALHATYRAERWRRNLAITQSAIVDMQTRARIDFGLLVEQRRLALGITQRELGSRAGIDNKTIHNIEAASFPPTARTIESILSVDELGLSWADVSPVLLESNPADGRKNRSRKKK